MAQTARDEEFEAATGPRVPVLDRRTVQFLSHALDVPQNRIYSWALELFVENLGWTEAETREQLDRYFGTEMVEAVEEHMKTQRRAGRDRLRAHRGPRVV